jgi:hypothetical protein
MWASPEESWTLVFLSARISIVVCINNFEKGINEWIAVLTGLDQSLMILDN